MGRVLNHSPGSNPDNRLVVQRPQTNCPTRRGQKVLQYKSNIWMYVENI